MTRGVGDDVLHRHRVQAHLLHGAVERFGRIGVHAERAPPAPGRMRPTSDSSMFALTCICVRSAAMMNSSGADMLGVDRLALVDAALDDDAVDRRGDDRVVEIHLRLVDRGLGLHDRRLRRLQLRLGLLQR